MTGDLPGIWRLDVLNDDEKDLVDETFQTDIPTFITFSARVSHTDCLSRY